jgi:hypothetical protein
MADKGHPVHPNHTHQHGSNCGHKTVKHQGHLDYVHDGHLHSVHGDHVECHHHLVTVTNPNACTPKHACGGHGAKHVHGPKCGHEAHPHGDHVDYLVWGHLHYPHTGHCDDHGKVVVA